MGRPDFIIPGMAGAGTTSLHRHLTKHPKIFMATRRPKIDDQFDSPPNVRRAANRAPQEMNYFSRHWQEMPPQYYYAHFSRASKGVISGEKSPLYITQPDYLLKMRSMLGDDIKFIVMLRNPIRRVQLQLIRTIYRRKKSDPSPREFGEVDHLREILRHGNRRKIETDNQARHGHRHFLSVIANGFYDIQMASLFDIFPRSDTLIIYAEDYRKDNVPSLDRTTDFLGVARHKFRPQNLPSERPVSDEMWDLLAEVYRPSVARLHAMLGDQQILDWGIL